MAGEPKALGKPRPYRVDGLVTISVSAFVMARSEAEALRIAAAAPMREFCHQCASQPEPGDEPEWCAEELDGEVTSLSVADAEDEDDDG